MIHSETTFLGILLLVFAPGIPFGVVEIHLRSHLQNWALSRNPIVLPGELDLCSMVEPRLITEQEYLFNF